jgi:hypothetical protein
LVAWRTKVQVRFHRVWLPQKLRQLGDIRCDPLRFIALRSLAGENRLLHTNTPNVPGQRETNDTGLAATSKVDTHNGA